MNWELPPGWVEVELGELSSQIDYGYTASAKTADVGPKFIRITDIQDGNVDWSAVPYCECENIARFGVRQNDILFARTGATTGKSYLIDFEPPPSVFASYLIRVRPTSGVSPHYLSLYMKSPSYWSQIASDSKGTAQPGVNASVLAQLTVPLPPLPEQHRIVERIEALLAKGARAKAALDALPPLLDRYRQSLLAAAFRGDLTADWRAANEDSAVYELNGEVNDADLRTASEGIESGLPLIPDSWVWVRLPALGELGRGKSKHRPRNDPQLFGGPYPFLQTGEVAASGGLVTSYTQTYSEFGLRQSKLWPRGTLCITIAANIAETGILNFSACFPDSVVGFFPRKDTILVGLVEFFIRTAKADLERFAPATAQKNINLEVLSNVFVPVPPMAEQHLLLNAIQYGMERMAKLESTIERTTSQHTTLTQSILAKAFRGELVPQDPADEAASVLLERIRAERVQMPKRSRRGKVQ
ncbi:restriction endonuclease subunit S [Niveispirillum irakense]|uniref:restriction endonuclease subunit S n=1 Tax=Niveispirillum irakense TaxID=34011 RepID=UPI00137860C5|nr:restriction endonuclease subunit S [Niveispirillum irakense]